MRELSIIAAVAENGVIGKNNQLIWQLPADMQFFKHTTMGHTLIMGRKTFESFGKPLPGRTSIVITRSSDFSFDGVSVAHSLADAIAKAPEDEEVFVIGGSQIYAQVMPLAQRMYITWVHQSFEGDSFFPEISEREWLLVSEKYREADEKNAFAMSFTEYIRR